MFYDQNTQSQSTLKPVSRTSEEQAKVDDETSEMALYHYDSCFFCARVRKVIELLQLKIEFRNIMEHQSHALDLLGKGGSGTVPCLHQENPGPGIEQWMYESADIISYLRQRFER